MITRACENLVRNRLSLYPAVALVGPRQCGKTTLAHTFGGRYFDLEQEPERLRLDLEWEHLVAGDELVIMDEAQSWPDIFIRLRGAIDSERARQGRFLLLGSVSPSLMLHVSESLAGRLSLIELTPLLLPELPSAPSRKRRWLHGGYPDGGVIDAKKYPRWQLDYISLLTQRDLPNWGLAAKPVTTERFLRMLAALHGQEWNASQVGSSLGISYHTVNNYMDYLVGAFLIRRLPPYQANIKKRLVKSPKIYWRDSGILHALLNVPDDGTLLAQPWVGASWEGYVIEQAIGVLSAHDAVCNAHYFRTSDRQELDLVLDFGTEIWAVEIKLTSAPRTADMARLNKVADMIQARRRFLVSQTTQSIGNENQVSCGLPQFLNQLTTLSMG